MCSLCPPLTTQYLAVRYSSLGSPRTWNPTALRVPAKVQKGACTVHRRTKLLPRRAADIRGQERAKPIQPLSVGRLGQTGLLLGGSTVSEMKHVDSVAAARTLSTLLNSTKRTTPVAVVSTPAGRDASYIDAEELHAEVGALVLGGLATPPGIASAATVRAGETRLGKTGFRSVAPNVRDAVTLPQAFTHDVVVAWGDPVTSDAPAFDVERQTTASASRQFGYNCDYVGVLPLDDRRALLVANHEYTNPRLMFPLQYLQQ